MIEVIKFPSKWRNKLFDPTHFSLKCKCPNCGSKVRISHIYDLQYDKEKCISYICPYCDANYPTHSCIKLTSKQCDKVNAWIKDSSLQQEDVKEYFRLMGLNRLWIENVYNMILMCNKLSFPHPLKLTEGPYYKELMLLMNAGFLNSKYCDIFHREGIHYALINLVENHNVKESIMLKKLIDDNCTWCNIEIDSETNIRTVKLNNGGNGSISIKSNQDDRVISVKYTE